MPETIHKDQNMLIWVRLGGLSIFFAFTFLLSTPSFCGPNVPDGAQNFSDPVTSLPLNDLTSLYGIKSYYNPKYYSILSPALADSLSKGGVIQGLYQLGEKKPVEKGPDAVNKYFLSDPVVGLIRQLFWAIPGDYDTLLTQRILHNFAAYLKPSTVGKLMEATLVQNSEGNQADRKKRLIRLVQDDITPENWDTLGQGLANEMKKLGFSVPDHTLDSFFELQKRLEVEKSGLQLQLKGIENGKKPKIACESENSNPLGTETSDSLECVKLRARIDSLQEGISKLNENIDRYRVEPFIRQLLSALEYCQRPESIYSPYFPIQVLQVFILLKSKHYRQTLLEQWKHMPSLLSPLAKDLIEGRPEYSEARKKDFLSRTISVQQFDHLATRLVSVETESPDEMKKTLLELLSNPDDTLAALEYEHHHSKDKSPNVMNQSVNEVAFLVSKDGPTVSSTDCCEASFLNFFSYFRQNLDDPLLRDGQPRASIGDQTFLSFALENLNPKDSELRGIWKKSVSNLDGVTYYKSVTDNDGNKFRYDLEPSIDNFAAIAEHFLGIYSPAEAKQLKIEDRLNRVCNYFKCEYWFDRGASGTSNQIVFRRLDSKKNTRELGIDIQDRHCHAAYRNFPPTSSLYRNIFESLMKPQVGPITLAEAGPGLLATLAWNLDSNAKLAVSHFGVPHNGPYRTNGEGQEADAIGIILRRISNKRPSEEGPAPSEKVGAPQEVRKVPTQIERPATRVENAPIQAERPPFRVGKAPALFGSPPILIGKVPIKAERSPLRERKAPMKDERSASQLTQAPATRGPGPAQRPGFLPLIMGRPLSSTEAVLSVVRVIFQNRLIEYYPIGLKLLTRVPWDYHVMDVLQYTIGIPQGLEIPEYLVCDFVAFARHMEARGNSIYRGYSFFGTGKVMWPKYVKEMEKGCPAAQ